MKSFDWYLFKNLAKASVFIALVLVAIVFLTQSLRFLELVMEAGASGSTFWVLTFLALPRFFSVICPLAVMAAVLFIYNKMTLDSELVVIRATGYSPFNVTKSALVLASVVTVFLYALNMYIAPVSLNAMQKMRHMVQAEFSSLLFREGVFNQLGDGLTLYVRERYGPSEMRGILIHDSRAKDELPSTVFAKRGVIVSSEEGGQVIVYEGARQQFNPEKQILQRLKFERYTIDLPTSEPIVERWSEPDERTIFELLNPDRSNKRDQESLNDFALEIHKRVTNPLLTIVFTVMVASFLLIGPIDRRGQISRIVMAIGAVVVLQSLYLIVSNIARQHIAGLILLYAIVIVPGGVSIFFLSASSENIRRKILYAANKARPLSSINRANGEVSE